MPQVASSAILRISYEAAKRELTVVFVSGRAYVYFGVPPEVYDQFMRAPSKGEFFNLMIRDRYAYAERGR